MSAARGEGRSFGASPPAVYVRPMTRARLHVRARGADHRAGRRRGCAAVIASLVAPSAPPPLRLSRPASRRSSRRASTPPTASWRPGAWSRGRPSTSSSSATVAISNPFTPGTFAGKNIIASICALPAQGCTAPASLTAYRSPEPVSRDRRYFVKVNSRKGGRGPLSSQVWVIDKEKPLLPGGGRPRRDAHQRDLDRTAVHPARAPRRSRPRGSCLQSAPRKIGARHPGRRARARDLPGLLVLRHHRPVAAAGRRSSSRTSPPGPASAKLFVLRPRPAGAPRCSGAREARPGRAARRCTSRAASGSCSPGASPSAAGSSTADRLRHVTVLSCTVLPHGARRPAPGSHHARRGVDPAHAVGRDAVAAEILAALRTGESVSVPGERRHGKTVLSRIVEVRARALGWTVVTRSLEGSRSIDEVTEALAHDLVAVLPRLERAEGVAGLTCRPLRRRRQHRRRALTLEDVLAEACSQTGPPAADSR